MEKENINSEHFNKNELIIMYPEKELEKIVDKLKHFGFVEQEKNRIDLGDKIITNLIYNGNESFNTIINEIKNEGIVYEIPGTYKTCSRNDQINLNYF